MWDLVRGTSKPLAPRVLCVALALLSMAGAKPRRATPPDACTLYHPSYSPRAPRIVFSSNCEGKWNVYVMDEGGANPVRLTDNVADARRPAWSPDGSQVIFETNRDGDWEIYRVAPNGSLLTRLTNHPAADTSATYSPDGGLILFSSARDGARQLFVMRPDGSGVRRVTHGAGVDLRPAWSADGSHLLYPQSAGPGASEGEPVTLMRVRPDGTGLPALPGGPRREYNHAYSPDGTQIAYDAHRDGAWESDDGQWEIWLMETDGSRRRRLTHNDVNDWGPAWSPDGSRVVFLSGMKNVYDIYTIKADGTDLRRLTRWTADEANPGPVTRPIRKGTDPPRP